MPGTKEAVCIPRLFGKQDINLYLIRGTNQ